MQGNEFPGSTLLSWLMGYGAAFTTLPIGLQYGFAALFGLAIGSFLTVVIHRLPIMMERAWQADIDAGLAARNEAASAHDQAKSEVEDGTESASESHHALIEPTLSAGERYDLSLPRSSCPQCDYQIRWRDNIPLLSYLLSRGRCRGCHSQIGLLYPCVEGLTMLFAMATLWRFGAGWPAIAAFGLCATLIALAFIDARTHLLPDSITLPLMWAGLLLNLGGTFVSLSDAVIGAVVGYLFLWAVYWGFRLLRGKEGMGYGDFKLLAALGAWFGWEALPQIILISALTGSIVGLLALARGRLARDEALPFGPYLAIAGLCSLFLGDLLRNWVAPSLFS